MLRFFTLAALVLCINATNYVEQVKQEKIDNRPLISSSESYNDQTQSTGAVSQGLSLHGLNNGLSNGQVNVYRYPQTQQTTYKVYQAPQQQQVSYQVQQARYPQLQQVYQTQAAPEVSYQVQAAPEQVSYQVQAAPEQVSYQAPVQQYTYQAPTQQYTYQAPAQVYQAPAQVYQAPAQQVYQVPTQQVYQAPTQVYQLPAQEQTYQYQAAPVVSYQQAPQVTVVQSQQQQPQVTSYLSQAAPDTTVTLPETKNEQSQTAFSAPSLELNNQNTPSVQTTTTYESNNGLSQGSNAPNDELPRTVPLKFRFGTTTVNRAGTKF